MNPLSKKDDIITALYNWVTSYKNKELIKDTSKIQLKFDAYVDSSISDPLSFTVFELSEKGELLIDETAKIIESQAAFFLFVNTKTGWVFAIKNTLENQKKLIKQEPIQNFKVKISH